MSEPITIELASAGGKSALNFLEKIGGGVANDMISGSGFGIDMKIRAVRNQIRGIEKLRKMCEEVGFNLKQVNLKVLFPYLEGIALEEDPALENLWAELMKNYLDANKNLTTTVYPRVLQQLSSEDVKYLLVAIKYGGIDLGAEYHLDNEFTPVSIGYLDIANIERLGLIKNSIRMQGHPIGGQVIHSVEVNELISDEYELTNFGAQFLEAVGVQNEPTEE